jgi:hypothetical protein
VGGAHCTVIRDFCAMLPSHINVKQLFFKFLILSSG